MGVWHARFDVEDALAQLKSDLPKKAVRQAKAQMAKARTRDSTQAPALAKLTAVTDGQRQIISDPPLIAPIEELAGHSTSISHQIRHRTALRPTPVRRHWP